MLQLPTFRDRWHLVRCGSNVPAWAMILLLGTCIAGCGKTATTIDTTPFTQAVVTYLEKNDMALKIKAIKSGPDIDGDKATMTASMTHIELGGPSVTWNFEFQKQAGSWVVVSHGE